MEVVDERYTFVGSSRIRRALGSQRGNGCEAGFSSVICAAHLLLGLPSACDDSWVFTDRVYCILDNQDDQDEWISRVSSPRACKSRWKADPINQGRSVWDADHWVERYPRVDVMGVDVVVSMKRKKQKRKKGRRASFMTAWPALIHCGLGLQMQMSWCAYRCKMMKEMQSNYATL